MPTNVTTSKEIVDLDTISTVAKNMRIRSYPGMTQEEAEAIVRKALEQSPGFTPQIVPGSNPSPYGMALEARQRNDLAIQQFNKLTGQQSSVPIKESAMYQQYGLMKNPQPVTAVPPGAVAT